MKLQTNLPKVIIAGLLLVIAFLMAERFLLIRAVADQKNYRYLVIGPDSFYLPKSFTFANADDLHFDQAQLACETLLNRGPAGIDSKERLERLFLPSAYEKAKELIDKENVDFKNRSIHQKCGISEIQKIGMEDNSVLIQVKGQLIRTGRFMGNTFVEVLEFECRLRFVANRRVLENGRYPTNVYNFNLKTKVTPSI